MWIVYYISTNSYGSIELTHHDMERYFKLSVLGSIPLYNTKAYMTEREINKKYGNMVEEETKQ